MPWGVAAAVGGAYIASQGAQSAASTQAGAQQQSAATQRQLMRQLQRNQNPYMQAGRGATVGLRNLFGSNGSMNKAYQNFSFDPSHLSKMPGFNFQLQQGDRALQSSDATTVGALSGAAMKDLMKFNQGLANTYEQQYYNQALSNYQTNQQNYYGNQNNIFNRLNQISSLGENAAANTGNQTAQLGTGVAQAQAAAGASEAAGQIGSSNAYAGAANTIPMYMLGGYSDRRLKEDIKRVGQTDNGLPLYSFRYIGDTHYHIGPMSDEVRKVQPEAVFQDDNGYDLVHYGMIR